ncbi:amidase [Solirubrobacter soli]|uniref:amidase n=1 Tax=Solirubrobacter soli TaxID=363832 RepID=UPI00069F1218|nr:amidase [Solirubrobacter soli]
MDPCLRSAVELRSALAVGEVSAVEVLEAVLGRADRLAGPINPFAVRLDERARSAALAADSDLTLGRGGPLCGVPVTIKDSHYLAGVSAASGSRALEAFVPAESSVAVERLEAAGAVIFAKTTTPEFCYFGTTDSPVNGRTSNPWDLGRTPGGSSGGAGAAVAAGLGPLALGGDGGGSIRIPAAFCGLVGFKPTFGLVPREPCAVAWKTLVAYGPMARSVADARLMLRALAGWHPRDRHSLDVDALDTPVADPRGLRVVASEDLGFAPLDDDVRAAFRTVIALLEDAGAQIIDDTTGLGSSVMTWSTIATAEARHAEASSFEHHHALLGEAAAEFMAHGGRVTREQYVSAQMAREPIHRAYVDLFDRSGASVLLTPTLGIEAFAHGSAHPRRIGGLPVEAPWLDWCGLLYDANLAGLPACAVPVGFGDDGLPVSVQVLGPRGSDGAVLAAAEAIERLVDFSARPTEFETLEK